MRYAYILGYLAGTALKAQRAARDLHRTEKAATWLAADNMRLQAEVDTLRAELVKARVEIDRAWGFEREHLAEWERELAYDREGEQ